LASGLQAAEEPRGQSSKRMRWFDTVRVVGRMTVVTVVMVSTVALQVPQWLLLRSLGQPAEARSRLGRGIAKAAERLGPVFVKTAQMVSHRTDLLPEDLLSPLRRIQDRVRPESFQTSRRTLERALGSAKESVFSSFEATPVAAGSVATVYKAHKRDGTAVAVKIVRKDVSEIVDIDLRIGGWLIAAASKLPALKGIPVVESFAEIEKLFRAQLDMRFEASNLDAMRSDSFISSHVRIPRPHHELCRREVLVMEFVGEAVNISDSQIDPALYRHAARAVLLVLYRMVFSMGGIHCDMHPGNIILDSDGQVWLIDGGFFAFLSDRDRMSFQELFLGLSFGEPERCCDSLIRSAISVPAVIDRPSLQTDVNSLVQTHHGKCAGSFLVAAFVLDLFKVQKRHRLFARSNFVAAIWAFVTFEGLVRSRFPDLDFQEEAKPFAISGIIRSMRTG
jgi:ubiquinone biosynthesis protein